MTNEDIDRRIRVLCDAIPFFIEAFKNRCGAESYLDTRLRLNELQREIIVLARQFVGPKENA